MALLRCEIALVFSLNDKANVAHQVRVRLRFDFEVETKSEFRLISG